MSSRLLRGLGTRQFGDGQFLAVHGGKGFVAAELEHDPILEDFPEDVWDHTFQTGLKGTLYGM